MPTMCTAGKVQRLDSDEERLRLTLERLLSEAQGRVVRIATLTRTPSPFATLFPAEVLSLTFCGGGQLSLFLKHLGSEQSDHPEKQRRDREMCIYQELLRDAGLPVVRYYGSRWNGASRRYELFLEYIDDWNLKYHELAHWFHAARRLGELHAHFSARAERLSACDFLLRLDAAYFRSWMERAISTAASHSAGLRRIAGEYERAIRLVVRQPVTLVHNDLAPKNVLADRSTRPSRICLIDWEMSGVGCGLLDLVDLKYGLDPVSEQRMRTIYSQAVAHTGLLPSDPRELDALFAACELHRIIYRVAFAQSWDVPDERVAQWIGEAQQLMSSI